MALSFLMFSPGPVTPDCCRLETMPMQFIMTIFKTVLPASIIISSKKSPEMSEVGDLHCEFKTLVPTMFSCLKADSKIVSCSKE